MAARTTASPQSIQSIEEVRGEIQQRLTDARQWQQAREVQATATKDRSERDEFALDAAAHEGAVTALEDLLQWLETVAGPSNTVDDR